MSVAPVQRASARDVTADLYRPQTPEDWNTRYLAYVAAQGGRSPEDQLADDAERFPGGKMAGFILWIGERWRTWRAENRVPRDAPLFPADHAAFDAWLWAELGEPEPAAGDQSRVL